jgi:hypothetical protein
VILSPNICKYQRRCWEKWRFEFIKCVYPAQKVKI